MAVRKSEQVAAEGLASPWKLTGQRFDMDKHPHELHLARWRANRFLAFLRQLIGEEVLLAPVCNALNSL